MAFHPSGKTHVGTNNPKITEDLDRSALIADIEKKKMNFKAEKDLSVPDGPTVIGTIDMLKLFKNSPPVYQLQFKNSPPHEPKRLVLNNMAVTNCLDIREVNDVNSKLSSLIYNRKVPIGILGIIQHVETGELTFFTKDGVLMRLNRTTYESMCQLPGFEPMYTPMKNLIRRIEKTLG